MPVLRSTANTNRNQQKFGPEAIRRRLMGVSQPAGMSGILGRGKNVYNTGSYSAHRGGGPQYGRPTGSRDLTPLQSTIRRRIAQRARFGKVGNGY